MRSNLGYQEFKFITHAIYTGKYQSNEAGIRIPLSRPFKRGAAIIKARGLSSAASTANAAIDTVANIVKPTAADDVFSVGICSQGEYGIEPGLMYSYPTKSDSSKLSVVEGVKIGDFSQEKITATENELKEEKSLVSALL